MKKLIVNPTKADQVQKTLDFQKALTELVHTVLRIESKEDFRPTVAKSDYINRFLQKVEYKVVAVSKYSGRELNTYEETLEYFNEIGTAIYGSPLWLAKYLKAEIERSPEQVFGVKIKAEYVNDLKAMMKDTLADLFEIDAKNVKGEAPAAPTGELVIKSSKVRQKEAEEAAKKQAESQKSAAEQVLDEALNPSTPATPDTTTPTEEQS